MGLESFSYISSLNSSNPVHATDQVSQGDDHIRGVKLTLLQSFPNINAAVNFTPTEANRLVGLTGLTGTGNLVASASPTFTGTLTAAAIAATTYDGIAAANLVDKSATETISGAWTFSATATFGAIAATTYDGVAAANLVDKSAAETVTGAWNFSTAPQVASLEVGHATDTTLTRSSAGNIEVEGRAIITHNDAALGSGQIYVSTSARSGGSDGDIWLEREA